jgi:Flp pilus assembly protein TadB
MQLVSIKTIIAMFWVSAVSLAGLAGHVNSLSSWTLLTGIAVLPLLVMMRGWNEPQQSMSQSIQEALRSRI